jgi:hypothetical protein
MVAHIRQILNGLIERFENPTVEGVIDDITGRLSVLREELDGLITHDFAADARWTFLDLRRRVRNLVSIENHIWLHYATALQKENGDINTLIDYREKLSRGESVPDHSRESVERDLTKLRKSIVANERQLTTVADLCKQVTEVLNSHLGIGSRAQTRSFAFVTDTQLRTIIERDYGDLTRTLMPDGAWKSAVVMAGSILEAILYDQLTKDATTVNRVMTWPDAPKKKKGKVVRDITKNTAEDRWDLADLIKASASTHVGLIPQSREDSIDEVLREYRNFIHPKRELRAQHSCTEAEAMLAKGGLDAICNHIEAQHNAPVASVTAGS